MTNSTPSKPEFSRFVSISTAIEYFEVQKELQENGILLSDLDSGDIITGQVDLTDIGLIIPSPQKIPLKRQIGFVTSSPNRTPKYDGALIDAVLSAEGYIGDNQENSPQIALFLIKVIANTDLEFWSNLAYTVATSLASKHGDPHKPYILMGVAGMSVPGGDSPNSAQKAIRRRFQKFDLQTCNSTLDFNIATGDENSQTNT